MYFDWLMSMHNYAYQNIKNKIEMNCGRHL